jgi:hypothetical protein
VVATITTYTTKVYDRQPFVVSVVGVEELSSRHRPRETHGDRLAWPALRMLRQQKSRNRKANGVLSVYLLYPPSWSIVGFGDLENLRDKVP